MSAHRRITDPASDASGTARDLIASARSDSPAPGARERARARLEAALSAEGVTTNVQALSAAAASQQLSNVLLTPVAIPPSSAGPAHQSPTPARDRTVLFSVLAATVILGVSAGVVIKLLPANRPGTEAAPTAPHHTTAPATAPTAAAPTAAAPTAAAPTTAAPTAAAPTAATPLVASAGTTEPATAAPGSASAGASETGRHSSSSTSSPSRGARESRPSGTQTASASSAPSAPAAAPSSASSGGSTASQSCAQRCRGSIDCLLRCGTESGGGGASRPAAAPAANLPETPSRTDVLNAMNGVRGAVQRCGGPAGTATVAVTFAGTGRVVASTVGAPYGGTSTGACISRVVRGAVVPRFARPLFQVSFPFVLC